MSIYDEYNQWIIDETVEKGLENVHITSINGALQEDILREFLFIERGIADGSIETKTLVFGDSRKFSEDNPCCDTCECYPKYNLP